MRLMSFLVMHEKLLHFKFFFVFCFFYLLTDVRPEAVRPALGL